MDLYNTVEQDAMMLLLTTKLQGMLVVALSALYMCLLYSILYSVCIQYCIGVEQVSRGEKKSLMRTLVDTKKYDLNKEM